MTNKVHEEITIRFVGREIRNSLGYTVREVEAATTIAKSSISKWETGQNLPSLDALAILADFYGVNWSDLVVMEKAS